MPKCISGDDHPSCDLDLVKNVWKCRSCQVGGGIVTLIIAAGQAKSRPEAAVWLQGQLGIAQTRASRPMNTARTPVGCFVENSWLVDLRRALVIEAEGYRTKYSIEGQLLASEVNTIREAVAQRYRVQLKPSLRPLYEGGFGGRERNPAWRGMFEWALFVASARLLSLPVAFDERLLPPRMVLLAAEDLAATAMRFLEHEARAMSVLEIAK